MPVQTRKVDTKARVILPEQFAGKIVSVDQVGESEIRIRVVKSLRRRPSLQSLLSGVPADYEPDEISFGPPVGDEAL
ncbi:MAG TPA: hypothetical protein VGL71_01730 [Urbifossiella sp.]|jgi:hypothetical protein